MTPPTTPGGTALGSGSASQAQGWALAPSRDTATALLAANDTAAAHLGPGAYSVPSSIGSGPAATIRSRVELRDPHADGPAPGSYDVPLPSASAPSSAVSMERGVGRSGSPFPSTSTTSADAPAPGSYDVPSLLGVDAPAASIRSRVEVRDVHAGGVSPGQYAGAHLSTLGTSGARGVLSMDATTGRRALFESVVGDPSAPAPGAYELPSSIGAGRAATIRSRVEVKDVHAGGAAPGQYDGAHTSTLTSSAGPGMDGQAPRRDLFADHLHASAITPAPGSYELPSSIGAGRAASIRSRLEEVDVHAFVPAPGLYDGAHRSTFTADGTAGGPRMDAQLGRAELFDDILASAHSVPAPGAYKLPDTMGQGPAATIRSRMAALDPRAAVPGPGQYSGAYASQMGTTASAASMDGPARAPLFPVHSSDDACVGAYDLPSLVGQGPAASIRSRVEVRDVHAGGVAVGQYDGAYSSTLHSTGAAAVDMDRGSERGQLFRVDLSGPAVGQYSPKQGQMGTEGPAATIRSRLQPKDPHAYTPAPGAYDVSDAQRASASPHGSVSMERGVGRSGSPFPSTSTTSADAPAPGSYDVPSLLGVDAPAASIRSRVEVRDVHAGGVSPGQYAGAHLSTLGTSGARGVLSMDATTGRRALFESVVGDPSAPAPGAYELPSSIGAGRAATIRSRVEVKDVHAGGAAPGQYDGAHTSTLTSSAGPGMDGQAPRRDLFADHLHASAITPAPGSYELPSSIGAGRAASIRSRLEEVDVHAFVPAPGLYDGAHRSTFTADGTAGGPRMDAQLGRAELFDDILASAHSVPAPGAYKLPDTMGQGPAATIRSRMAALDPRAAVPGPGQYSGAYASQMGTTASAASMDGPARAPLFPVHSSDDACVGAYDLPSLVGQGPAASIRSRVEVRDVHAGGVAVGQYDGAYSSTLHSTGAAAVDMDRGSERGQLFRVDLSGPAVGQYSPKQGQMGTEGPAATIRSRLQPKDPHAYTPAPGAYDVSDAQRASASPHGSVSMERGVGRSGSPFPSTSTTSADAPAPGSYDVPSLLGVDAPAASIRSRVEVRDVHAGGVSPGQYAGAHLSTLGTSGARGVLSMDATTGRRALFESVVGDPSAPAPGAYELPSSIGAGRAATIRSRVEVKDVHARGAAPGQYDGAHTSTLTSSAGPGMDGQAPRRDLFADHLHASAITPAPGSYELPSSIGAGRAASIRSRLEEVDVHAFVPAPGLYDGAHRSTFTADGTAGGPRMDAQLGRAELFDDILASAHSVPAPGAYKLPDTMGQGPAATIRSRMAALDPRAAVPGVGSYEVALSTLSLQSGADMARASGRVELFDASTSDSSPAPGQYEVQLQGSIGSGPAATIRSRIPQVDPHAHMPGVGSYDVDSDSLGAQQARAAAAAGSSAGMSGQSGRRELFDDILASAHSVPAPGSYSLPDTIGQGPAASIRSRTIDPLQVGATITPSPTAYDAHTQRTITHSASSSAMTAFAVQSGRKELHPPNADTAGVAPGSYSLPDSLGQGPAASMGTRTLDPLRVGATVTPAPGSYDVGHADTSAAHQPSFGQQSGRAELFQPAPEHPAPGHYDIPTTIGQGPAASIRSRAEVSDPRALYPGVGSYSPEASSSSSSTAASAVSMASTSGRSAELFAVNKDTAAVAPGTYSLPAVLGVGAPAASLRSRAVVRDVHAHEPAPGSYSPEHFEALGSSAPAVRMRGYSERREEVFEHSLTLSQGPAAYDVRQGGIGQEAHKHSIGVRRELRDERSLYPAPGAYDTTANTSAHPSTGAAQVSMDGQSARRDLWGLDASGRQQQPAPGSYDLPDTLGQGPAAAIRSRIDVRDERDTFPALGAYDGAHTSTLTSSAGPGMDGQAPRRDLFADHLHASAITPAPGSYELPSSIGAGRAASIRSRLEEVDVHAFVPAPGLYDGAHRSTFTADGTAGGPRMDAQLGRAELFDDILASAHSVPAPGAYKLPDTMGQGPAATIRSRMAALDPRAAVPGVGSYEVALSTLSLQSGADMARASGRVELFDASTSDSSPAPGQYEVQLQGSIGSGPAATIRSRIPQVDPHAHMPGVGSYDVDSDSLGAQQARAAAAAGSSAGMSGQSGRRELFDDILASAHSVPAPGSYSLPDTIGQGPAASIRSRTIDPLQVGATITPSPTAYDAHTQRTITHSASSSAMTAFAVQSGRKELHPPNADTAGVAPGSYSLPDSLGQGPAASMGTRTLDPLRVGATVTPAPGSYDVGHADTSAAHQPSFGQQSGRAELFQPAPEHPAPGHYDIPTTIGQGPAASIRSRAEARDERLHYPGVGQYDVAASEAALLPSHSSSAVAFAGQTGRSELFAATASSPAPGAYSLPSTIGAGPTVSMHARTADPLSVGATAHLTPGPAAYDVRYPAEQTERDFTFGGVYRPSANLRQFLDGGRDGGWMRGAGEQSQSGGADHGGSSRSEARSGRAADTSRPDADSYNTSGPGLLD